MINVLAMPVLVGMKTPRERFPGAVNTLTLEGMMGDGKALQMGTSHELGQNFATAFGIEFLDDAGAQQTAWTTSWGVSTRMMGGLILAHGDDAGLRVPPVLAATQVVVVVVRDDDAVVERARAITSELAAAGVRAILDDKTSVSAGRRLMGWELKGVPIRIELGPRDLAEGAATVVCRITGEKSAVSLDGLIDHVRAELDRQQMALLGEAVAHRENNTADVKSLDEAREAATTGWARIPWALVGEEGETELATAGITVRCLTRADGTVPDADDEPDLVATVARSY